MSKLRKIYAIVFTSAGLALVAIGIYFITKAPTVAIVAPSEGAMLRLGSGCITHYEGTAAYQVGKTKFVALDSDDSVRWRLVSKKDGSIVAFRGLNGTIASADVPAATEGEEYFLIFTATNGLSGNSADALVNLKATRAECIR